MHSDPKHCYCVSLSLKVKVIAKIESKCLREHSTQKQNKQEICPVIGVQLVCQIFMNDLHTEQGQQRSKEIR